MEPLVTLEQHLKVTEELNRFRNLVYDPANTMNRWRRRELKMGMREFGEYVGISAATVSRIERGYDPTHRVLMKLLDARTHTPKTQTDYQDAQQ